MSDRPQRDTISGRVYLDLQNRARRERRPTDELFVLYVLERFLYRLSVSPQREQLVLKGGMLLADPILTGEVSAGRWDPVELAWRR
jgi:hypothetical protein